MPRGKKTTTKRKTPPHEEDGGVSNSDNSSDVESDEPPRKVHCVMFMFPIQSQLWIEWDVLICNTYKR